MNIYVPSLHRASQLSVGRSVICELPRSVLNRTILVVPPDQVDSYKNALRSVGREEVFVADCPEKGIAKTRHWIGLNSQTKKFVMMDDDIKFQVRISPDTLLFRPAEEDDKEKMLEALELALDDYAHASISDRVAGANAARGEQVKDFHKAGAPPFIVENTRMLRVLAFQREAFLSVEHGRVDVMEDFDVALQLLKKGKKSGTVSWWVQDQRATQWTGGCSTYRTHDVHNASARRLAELHPGIVSLRTKVNKTGGEFGTRTEVTVQWKKCYEMGAALAQGSK